VLAGLVLAAGAGTRLGQPKATLELDGERLVDRAVRTLREGGLAEVVVVAGAARLDGVDGRVVDNPDWATGMGSSLRAGLAAMPDDADAVIVMLVDTPRVGAEAVRRLSDSSRSGAGLAIATYGGRRGHPVLLGRRHWAGVAEAAVGDEGARPYLRRQGNDVVEVPCDGTGDPVDVDTPEAARAVLGHGEP
jgi:CTP:molybdopterin cytidylyltransferase MocA